MLDNVSVKYDKRSDNTNQGTMHRNRLVLLGASNLTLSLRLVIQLMQRRCGNPSEVLVAAGHGRSYGHHSRVIFRGLPSITSCGLWPHLGSVGPQATFALLTDIGNDIPYGYQPADILKWVAWCIERLQRQTAHIVMTNLPITSVEALSTWHYNMLRSLFFPHSRLTKDEVVNRARELHSGLIELAAHSNVKIFELEPVWLGPDSIHILLWKRKQLYRRVFEYLPDLSSSDSQAGTIVQFDSNWRQRSQFASKNIFGREYLAQQPSGQLNDGTTISKY